jgi:hypothetical protein
VFNCVATTASSTIRAHAPGDRNQLIATLNMLSKISKPSLPAIGLVILLAVAGCGHRGPALPPRPPSAKSLISDMRSSFAIAQSVRIIAHLRDHGQAGTLDLSLFRSGALKGTVKTGGLSLDVLRADGRSYLYLSKVAFGFYRRSHDVPATVCAVACGKYILVPSRFFSNFSLKSLSRRIDGYAPKAGKRTRETGKNRKTGKKAPVPHVGLTTFEGQPAWELTEGAFKIFIAKQSGYLLGMSKSKVGVFRFSEWNTVPPIRAPRPNRVFVFR